jgi:hypothetical protein
MNPALLVSLSAVLAQDASDARFPLDSRPLLVHRSVTEIDFQAQNVVASANGPDGTAVLVRAQPTGFAPMIRLRLDFDDEMRASTSQID